MDGEKITSELITVEAGGTQSVEFERRFDEPGEYEIAVDETSLGTLTVTAANDDGTATRAAGGESAGSIEISGATVPADRVRKGYTTTVRATVVNTVNRTANRTLTVTVDDRPVANETVTLQPNERDVVTIEFEAVGGTIAVGGVEAGRIEVRESLEETRTESAAADDSGLAFEMGGGSVVAVALLAGVVLVFLASASVLVVRRNR